MRLLSVADPSQLLGKGGNGGAGRKNGSIRGPEVQTRDKRAEI